MEKYQFPKIKDEIQFENFTRDLLNLIYQDNSFQLYGRKGQAQYGLDGYSTIHPIFFQCKHKNFPHVKDKKLEEELESEFNKAKPKIEEVSTPTESKFLFFTTHPNTTKLQDKARVLSTDSIIVEYWGWETIESHLNNLYISKHRDFFSKYYPELAKILTTSKISPQLTTKLGKSTLIGREKELQEIDEQLKASKTLLVKGIGGVGKSTIASNYLHRHKDEYDYYGFFEGLSNFVPEIENTFYLENKYNNKLSTVLLKLRELKGEKLLIIDDITEVNKNKEVIEQILELKHSGYKIILTSREEIPYIQSYYLDNLFINDAINLFNSIYMVKEENLLKEIVELLDYHAFFIEMTARTLKYKKSLTPIKIKIFLKSGQFSKVRIKKGENLEIYLNKLFHFKTLTIEEKNILSKLTILPSIEIEFEYLEKIFRTNHIYDLSETFLYILNYIKMLFFRGTPINEKFEENLNALADKGWLNKTDKGYKLHQVIKEYILMNYSPNFIQIRNIITSIHIQMDKNNKFFDEKNYLYIESMLLFLIKIMSTKKEKVDYYNSLGETYCKQGLYEKAKSSYLTAIEISKTFKKVYPSIAISYNGLGEIYSLNGELKKAGELHFKALEIQKKYLNNKNHPDIAKTYTHLANYYKLTNQYQKAELLYWDSLKIQAKILGLSHRETLITYIELAKLYKLVKKNDDAEKIYIEVLNIREKNFGEEHLYTAMSCMDLARFYYFDNNNVVKAEKYILIARRIFKRLLPDTHEYIINTEKWLKMIEMYNDSCPCNSGKKYKKCCGKNS